EEQCQRRESYENTTYANHKESLPLKQRAGHDRSWLCLPAGANPHHLTKSAVHRAKAGCGWVVWQQEVWHPAKENEAVTLLPVDGADTEAVCHIRAKVENDAWKGYQERMFDYESMQKERWERDLMRGLNDVDRTWFCLRVGSDPRGPRGK